MKQFTTLGKKVTQWVGFETFAAPKGIKEIVCVSDEVTALCPVTAQPDWYQVSIKYAPAGLAVESKTLKLYLQSFRQQGLFCEA